jgi:preprotein translocase subunit SecA
MLKSLFGSDRERQIKRLVPILRQVRSQERTCVHMSNDALRAQTGKFKERLAQGESLDDILPEAFATCCEAAKRITGMRHFDVQVIGGTVLHEGGIAEMMTGEGKTLVATLPMYLNALTGNGVHLVTVNDYLARRDREWMGPIFEFLGLTVGLIQHDMREPERQVGYRADITYGTNNEYGFDYLRDNMAVRADVRVQRKLSYAIVDEIDSILIDEARTPLIISGRPEKSSGLYVKVEEAVRRLRKDEHYELEEKGHHVLMTEEGMSFAEKLLDVEDLYVDDALGVVHMLEQSLKAHSFYRKDDEYVVRDNQVLIVDEFTGRIQEGRRFSDGLHQALEAKENVPIQSELQTIASVTYQNYFRLYDKLAGMTGTAATEAGEFSQIYDLEVVEIPTNLPMAREDTGDLVYASEEGKFRGLVKEIASINKTGRPILVGTRSIERSEVLAKMLKEADVKGYEVLNAKYHDREASIIANAGKRGSITIATNMAGRGTDIKLGDDVAALGGLAIVGTERHESRRIDNQLRGRCGRQGDSGTTQFFLSLEDEVSRLFGGDRVKKMLEWFGSEDQLDEEPLNQKMVSRSIARAQRQWEEHNFEIRKHVKDYDDVMDTQRKHIYELRRAVLENKDVRDHLKNFFENVAGDMEEAYAPENVLPDEWDLEGLETRFRQLFHFTPRLDPPENDEPKPIFDDLVDQINSEYERREGLLSETLRGMFQEQVGGDDSHIDFAQLARKRMHDWEKMALLRAVDDKWIDHLYSMDYLRESVRLRAYGQKDPLVEYKTEGFGAFKHMIQSVEENVVQTLFRMTDPDSGLMGDPSRRRAPGPRDESLDRLHHYQNVGADEQQDQSFASSDTSRFRLAGQQSGAQQEQQAQQDAGAKPKQKPIRAAEKIKPNDPCPCGSGKKYKKCCGGLG